MDTILKILELWGEYGAVVGIALLLIYLIYLIGKKKLIIIIKKIISTIIQSENSDDLSDVNNLKYHPFFYNVQYRLIVEIPTLEICPDTPVKQQVFRDLIYYRIKLIHDNCLKITEFNMSQWSNNQWTAEMTKCMHNMMLEFIDISTNNGIPEIVIDKFKRWHSPTTDMLNEYVQLLGSSEIYENHHVRTATFFMIINLLLITTIADAERTLSELNGDIAGKTYKNKIIEH